MIAAFFKLVTLIETRFVTILTHQTNKTTKEFEENAFAVCFSARTSFFAKVRFCHVLRYCCFTIVNENDRHCFLVVDHVEAEDAPCSGRA